MLTTYRRAGFHGESSITPVLGTARHLLMFIDLKSKWFQCYCRALLETDPEQAQVYIADALDRIDERMHCPEIASEERQAIVIATRYLQMMAGDELRHAA